MSSPNDASNKISNHTNTVEDAPVVKVTASAEEMKKEDVTMLVRYSRIQKWYR